MTAPTLVFDLDGTLVDSAPDLMATLNVILVREGLEPVPLSATRSMIGHGARVLLERGLALDGVTPPPERIDPLFEDFLAHYAAHIADETRPFPGVVEAMDRLQAEGWRLAVCTNKLEWLSLRLLDELGLTGRFAAITGGDTFAARKPDALHLVETIKRAGGDVATSLMVGDSRTDIDTAKNAGVPVIAVDFGYTDVPVAELGPDRVISHFDDLYAAVRDLRPAFAR